MATRQETDVRRYLPLAPHAPVAPEAEQTALPLRPLAHWVLMPTGGGHARLEMVWQTPHSRSLPLSVAS